MSIKNQTSEDETEEKQKLKLDGSVLGEFIKYRLKENRDAKIIITSRSSSTGLGKSTLAILIAKWIQEDWSAENDAFINVGDYISSYLNTESDGRAIVLDEIEAGADSRRSMSSDNVNLSKAWATLRFKNVVTIATLPTTSMLDNRMMELADVWINVMSKGVAIPYFIWINDFTGDLRRVAAKHPKTGAKELIHWDEISDDEDFKTLSEMKNTDVFDGSEQRYNKDDVEKAKKKAARAKRNEIIETLYENTNLSQRDIGNLVDLKQQAVSQILNN